MGEFMKKNQMKILISMLKGNINFERSFIILKLSYNLFDMSSILQNVIVTKKYKNLLIDEMFPQSYNDIHLKKVIPFIYRKEKRLLNNEKELSDENKKELNFLVALMILNKKKIDRFIKLRKQFEIEYMNGNINTSDNILSVAEKEFGYSYWLVESKLMLLRNNHNRTDFFRYYGELIKNCTDSKIRIYLRILSDKVAEDIGQRYFASKLDTYFEKLDEVCDDINFCNYYKEYIRFMCYYSEVITPQLLRSLLAMSSHLGIIDKFILFEKIIVRMSATLAFDENVDYKRLILILVKELQHNIPYQVWNNIITLLDDENYIKVIEEKLIVHNALKLYCEGKYDDCAIECRKQLQTYSNNISLINLLAKCTDEFDGNKQYEKVAALLNSLYRKEGTTFEFVRRISGYDVYERIYNNLTFGMSLFVIIEHETECNVKYEKLIYVAALLMYTFTPSKLAFFLPDIKRDKFFKKYKEYCTPLYLCDWQISTYSEVTSEVIDNFKLDRTSNSLHEIKIASLTNLENIFNRADLSLEGKEKKEVNTLLIKKLFDLYTEEKRYFDAINIYLDAYFSSFYLVRTTDYKQLNKKLMYNVRKTLENNIEYCIYIYITKFGVNNAENTSEYVVSSFKEIMNKYGQLLPSKLKWPEDEKSKKCLAYFLFNVCNTDVLGRVLNLEQDVNNERIAIVERLIDYFENLKDEDALSTLSNEKQKLIQEKEALSITDCIHKGKINVGWIGLKDATEDAIIVTFERINFLLGDNEEMIEASFHEFIEGFTEIKKDYVQEVNRLLSICIRHGTLEYYLVSYFNKRGIISDYAKEKSTINAIEKFYINIYSLIDFINHKFVSFTDKKKFENYRSLYIEDDILKDIFKRQNTLMQPIDLKNLYLGILEDKLKSELEMLGESVYSILKQKLLNELIILDKYVENSMHDYVKICIDQLEMGLRQLKEWFAVAKHQATPYRFDAWLALLQSEYTCLTIDKSSFDDFVINGNSVLCLHNVFNNFLFNVIRHSGYSEMDPRLGLTLKIEQESNSDGQRKIRFRITNKVNKNKNQEIIIKDINKIKKLILSKKDIEKYQNDEGKSGYKKIIRLLERGFFECWDMDVGYKYDIKEFWVDLIIIFIE